MQDKELYEQILGLSFSWKDTDVELDRASSEIRVSIIRGGLSSVALNVKPNCHATIMPRSVDGVISTRANSRRFS